MAVRKKFDVQAMAKKVFAPAVGGIAGDVVMDLSQDWIPGIADTKWVAPLLTLTLGAAAEYFAEGKKGEQLKGVGSGMIGVSAAQLSANYFPGLSGQIGTRMIQDPVRRMDRTIPYSSSISQ